MKHLQIIALSLLVSLGTTQLSFADNFSGEWSLYSTTNYRGGKKTMNPGSYDNCHTWRYNSWKISDDCCVTLYYMKRGGGEGTKKICGSVRDLKREMQRWGSLKYGWQQGWKNVEKVKFECEGGAPMAGGNGNGGDMNLRRGYAYFFGSKNLKGQQREVAARRHNRVRGWMMRSLIIPEGYEMEFKFKGNNNRSKRETLKAGEYADLYRIFNSWGFRNRQQNYPGDMEEIYLYREGTNTPGQEAANTKYPLVFYGSKNLRGNKREFGQNLYTRVTSWSYRSVVIPEGYEVRFRFKGNNNGIKTQTLDAGKYNDLFAIFNRWGFRFQQGGQNYWSQMTEVDFRKANGGSASRGRNGRPSGGSNSGGSSAAVNSNSNSGGSGSSSAGNSSSNGSGGGGSVSSDSYEKGYAYFYGSRNLRGNLKKLPARRHDRVRGWYLQSLVIPSGYEIEFHFLGKNNRKKRNTLKAGTYNDLFREFNRWGFRNNGQAYWGDMELIDIRKVGSGNNGNA
nr:hypothetical protein [Saprospiraceae bacterium]